MAERPVECAGHCKRPIKVVYKEIAEGVVLATEMCEECPVLDRKLHGEPGVKRTAEGLTEGERGLYCGNCGTSLESLKTGNPLGCSECYAVFSDALFSELLATDAIPLHLKKSLSLKKAQVLHSGKSPTQPLIIPASSRLTALNEALNEALKKENYEQAAWLRDQIKALSEKGTDDGKK